MMPTIELSKDGQDLLFGVIGQYPKFPITKTTIRFNSFPKRAKQMESEESNLQQSIISQSSFRWISGYLPNYPIPEVNLSERALSWTRTRGNDMDRNPWREFPRYLFELGLLHAKTDE